MEHAPPADPIAAVTHPDPYPYYAELALRPPYRDEALGLWIIARPSDVRAALAHPAGRVVKPADAPAAFDTFARFTDGATHAALRVDVERRIAALQVDEPAIATDDLDTFVECYALYALVRGNYLSADLLLQSYDGVRALIGNAFAQQASRPELDAASAVREALRSDPPVQNTRRTFDGGAPIGGVAIPADEAALVVLVTMTFGSGAHACPGDEVAKRIAVAALERLHAAGVAPRRPQRYVPRPNVRIPLFA